MHPEALLKWERGSWFMRWVTIPPGKRSKVCITPSPSEGPAAPLGSSLPQQPKSFIVELGVQGPRGEVPRVGTIQRRPAGS